MAHRHMNVEFGAEAAIFPEKEYINGIAVAVYLLVALHHGIKKIYIEKKPQEQKLTGASQKNQRDAPKKANPCWKETSNTKHYCTEKNSQKTQDQNSFVQLVYVAS
jgi:hypothetical protein